MASLALARTHTEILASLRRLKGRVTVGDVVADSGLAADDVRAGLKELLESHRGHLEVSDSGELIYDFDPRLIQRDSEPLLSRIVSGVGRTLRAGFKGWIVVMLVGYFVVFVALVIAALVAGQRGNDSRGGWGGGRHRGGFHFDPLLWYWIWSPRWRLGRPYYGHRWERTLPKGDRVPFYKKVFAFVFGPDRPRPTRQQLDRGTLRLIRARGGVLTTAELVERTGGTFAEAEEEMGRLLGAYDGEAAASPNGEVVYAFPGLVASVGDRAPREPKPAWLRLEQPRELTGNSAGTNAAIVGMNAFTMLASATAPWFLFPRLGLGGTAAFVGLVLVPLVFSVLFFGGPLVRMAGVTIENRRRAGRNVRRLLLGLVYNRALDGRTVSESEAWTFVRERLGPHGADTVRGGPDGVGADGPGTKGPGRAEVVQRLRELAAELGADVEVEDGGDIRYAFPEVRAQYAASEAMRSRLRLGERSLGDVVFSTADDAAAAGERDLELFDRALLGASAPLDRYLPVVDRIDYEDDFELVAYDEELGRRP